MSHLLQPAAHLDGERPRPGYGSACETRPARALVLRSDRRALAGTLHRYVPPASPRPRPWVARWMNAESPFSCRTTLYSASPTDNPGGYPPLSYTLPYPDQTPRGTTNSHVSPSAPFHHSTETPCQTRTHLSPRTAQAPSETSTSLDGFVKPVAAHEPFEFPDDIAVPCSLVSPAETLAWRSLRDPENSVLGAG